MTTTPDPDLAPAVDAEPADPTRPPESLATDLRAAIPRSWLWVIPNGGHGPVFGHAAPMFAAMALAFLGGRYDELTAPLPATGAEAIR